MTELILKIADKEIRLPIDEKTFNQAKPIVVKFVRKDKTKYFSLRLTARNSLVLN